MTEWLHHFEFIAQGVLITLEFTLTATIGGIIFGLLFALMQMSDSRILNSIARIYLSIFRGTPMLVQLSIIYFGIPSVTPLDLSVFVAGSLALSLNSGAYVAEILRSGIQSIDKGQIEAAKSLGVPYHHMMFDLILPQAFRNIFPALMNEAITLLKDTALVSIIGGQEIMRKAQLVSAETYNYFTPLLMAAGLYYVMVMALSAFGKRMEKKLGAYAEH